MKPQTPQQIKIDKIREVLSKAGFDFIVTRHDEGVAHLNVWIGDDNE